jgi:hypothetical protein
MPLNFPDTPVINTTYTYNDKTYIWDGNSWTAPAGADWSSLGHTVSSLAIGF